MELLPGRRNFAQLRQHQAIGEQRCRVIWCQRDGLGKLIAGGGELATSL
jgi:hypothetical protein